MEWLDNDLTRRMIRDVDKSEYIGGVAVDSPFLGSIPIERLSGGVKTLILMTGICEIPREMLERTYDFADSTKYSSWERFYFNLLVENTKGTVYKYSKRHINKNYLTVGSRNKTLSQLPVKLELQ